jgi:hypothetical protein
MGKNKHVDLFNDMMPAVDLGIKALWDAVSEEGQKEIKGDLWNLNRFISNIRSGTREEQEFFVLSVNEYYNKNWNAIQKHPKLAWQTLCLCSHPSKKKFYHEYIPLKKEANKKEKFLSELFPNMKLSDIATLAEITTDKEIKEYAKDLGWDKKQIADIKL